MPQAPHVNTSLAATVCVCVFVLIPRRASNVEDEEAIAPQTHADAQAESHHRKPTEREKGAHSAAA
jgi:hypothetical protein